MLFNECMDLGRETEFLGIGPGVNDTDRRLFWLAIQNLVQGKFGMGTFPAASHQSRVYDDTSKPGGKRRPALKGAQLGEGRAQAVLHRILSIFFIAQHRESNAIQPAGVTRKEMLLCNGVSSDGLLNGGPFFAYGSRSGNSARIQPLRGTRVNAPGLRNSFLVEQPENTNVGPKFR